MTEATPSPNKKYYSISEVSEQLDVKPHVLRYWETQFSVLRPKKSRAGARMYQDRDLDALRSIKQMLYDRGYTIAGAKKHLLDERRKQDEVRRSQLDFDFLSPRDRKQLRLIRDELVQLRDWLADPDCPPPPRRLRRQAEISIDHLGVEG
jgi:DNA-binding transcriptional MerR regulator